MKRLLLTVTTVMLIILSPVFTVNAEQAVELFPDLLKIPAEELLPNVLGAENDSDVMFNVEYNTEGEILYQVWVGSKQVAGSADSGASIAVISPEITGSVVYTPAQNGEIAKLTLTDATIDGFNTQIQQFQNPDGSAGQIKIKAGIAFAEQLEIVLIGENRIDDGELSISNDLLNGYGISAGLFGTQVTISGTGSLEARGGIVTGGQISKGIMVAAVTLEESVTVNTYTTSTTPGSSQGGYILEGAQIAALTINGGTFNAYGSNVFNSVAVTINQLLLINGGTLNATGQGSSSVANSVGISLDPNSSLILNSGTINAKGGVLGAGGSVEDIANAYGILTGGSIAVNGGTLNATANSAVWESIAIKHADSTAVLNFTAGQITTTGDDNTALNLSSTKNVRAKTGTSSSNYTEEIEPASTKISANYIALDYVNAYPIWIAGNRVVTELNVSGTVQISGSGISGTVQYLPATESTDAKLTLIDAVITGAYKEGDAENVKATAILVDEDINITLAGANRITAAAFIESDYSVGINVLENTLMISGEGSLAVSLPIDAADTQGISKTIAGTVTLQTGLRIFSGTNQIDAVETTPENIGTADSGILYTEVRLVNSTVSGTVIAGNSAVPLTLSLYLGDNKVSTLTPSPVEGRYDFIFETLDEGTYTLVAEKEGFLKYTVTDLSVNGVNDLALPLDKPLVMIHGDINGDDVVNNLDIEDITAEFVYNLPTNTNPTPHADINGDGMVNFIDATIIRNTELYGATVADSTISYYDLFQ